MDDIDRRILIITGSGVPLRSEVFTEVAKKLKIDQDEVISRIRRLLDDGVIRRFGARINHRKVGFKANAMVVWRVTEDRVEEVGRTLSGFREVTHCYERRTIPGQWDYNLFSVVHGFKREEVELLVRKLSKAVGITDYEVLFSTKEFKKVGLSILDSNRRKDVF